VLGLIGSGALLLVVGALLAMTQIVSYPATNPLEEVGWLALIGAGALLVLGAATAGFPRLYVPPAAAAALGVMLCAGAVVFPLTSLSLFSRGIGLFGMASFGLTGLASLALAVTLARSDRRATPPPPPAGWWRLLALTLAAAGAAGLGLFFVAIANPGAILAFSAATSWLLAVLAALAALLRRSD
jgi:hypothetical protein